MKESKLLAKLADIIDSKKRHQRVQIDSLKKVLKKLKEKARELAKKHSREHKKNDREKLKREIKVVHAQRRKGLSLLKKLKKT